MGQYHFDTGVALAEGRQYILVGGAGARRDYPNPLWDGGDGAVFGHRGILRHQALEFGLG